MKLKSLFTAILIAVFLFNLIACDTPNAGDDTTVNGETTTPEEITTADPNPTKPSAATEPFKITQDTPLGEVASLAAAYNSKNLWNLPVNTFASDQFISSSYKGGDGQQMSSLVAFCNNPLMPIWFVEKIDKDHVYVVFAFGAANSNAITFQYLFFENNGRYWTLYGEGYKIPDTGVKPYFVYENVKVGDQLSHYTDLLYGKRQTYADPTTNFACGEAIIPLKEGVLCLAFSSETDYAQWKRAGAPYEELIITQVTFIPYGTQDVSYFNGQKLAITKIAGGPVFR